MGVSERNGIEARHPARPQIGRNDILTISICECIPEREAASVNEQRAAFWECEEYGIALADVNGSHFEHAGLDLRARFDF